MGHPLDRPINYSPLQWRNPLAWALIDSPSHPSAPSTSQKSAAKEIEVIGSSSSSESDEGEDNEGGGSGSEVDLSSGTEDDDLTKRTDAVVLDPVPVITAAHLLEKWLEIVKKPKIKGSQKDIEAQLTIPMCNDFDITHFLQC